MTPLALFGLFCCVLLSEAYVVERWKMVKLSSIDGMKTVQTTGSPVEIFSATPLQYSKGPMQQWIVSNGTANVTIQSLTEAIGKDGQLKSFSSTNGKLTFYPTNSATDDQEFNFVFLRISQQNACVTDPVYLAADRSVRAVFKSDPITHATCSATIISPKYGNSAPGITLTSYGLDNGGTVSVAPDYLDYSLDMFTPYEFTYSDMAEWNNTSLFGQSIRVYVTKGSTYSFGFSSAAPPSDKVIKFSGKYSGVFMSASYPFADMPLQNLSVKAVAENGRPFHAIYYAIGDVSSKSVLTFGHLSLNWLTSGETTVSSTSGDFGDVNSLFMQYVPAGQEKGFVIRYTLTAGSSSSALSIVLIFVAMSLFWEP
ncbi:hypothetical protein QR680_016787 [Steinernema hermaphroditum]|uniref:CUB-like domain-containing protein n=1 Tax=Steinernema hermaphroditum TaxID=289476 RepID=A0AA39LMW9_9BILA|nr:hypothetical protein QR680_016787 [Steinernema hermaphroditum]